MTLIKSIHVYSVLLVIVLLLVLIVYPAPALAFKPDIHGKITVEALNATQPTVDGQKLQFSQEAIQQIVDANKRTDDPAFQTRSEMHFDSENFQGGSKRLIDFRERVIKKITTTTLAASARADLGGALHTLQDFYAHSNWVELGREAINQDLGRQTFSGAGGGVATCPSDPGVLGGEGLKQLTSGYFLFSQALCGVPSGKCRHGIPVACPSGLNKDDPSRPGFDIARALAVAASQDFLNQILSDSLVAGNAKAIKLLLGIS